MGATAMDRMPAGPQASASTRGSVAVSRQSNGMPTRAHRPARVSSPEVRARGLGAQAADGAVDHDAALDHLDGGPVGVGNRLDAVEEDLEGAVGRGGRDVVDETLGLEDIVQQIELGIPGDCCHDSEIG